MRTTRRAARSTRRPSPAYEAAPALAPLAPPARELSTRGGGRWIVRVVARLSVDDAPERLVLRLERVGAGRPRARTVLVDAPALEAIDDTVLRAMLR